MLDLVPRDLPVEAAMDLARVVDPRAYRADRIGLGRGAGHALLIDKAVAGRLGVTRRSGLGPGEMAEITVRAKQYAVGSAADLVVAEFTALHNREGRRTWLTALSVMVPQNFTVPRMIAASVIGYVLVLSGLLLDPLLGLLPIVAYSSVPYLVTAGLPLRPRDRRTAACLRLLLVPLSWWRTLRSPSTTWEQARAEQHEKSRAWHQQFLDPGFFEPRRGTCPWCGSAALGTHLVTRDTMMVKPGRFVLERCLDCRHIFQNPRLNAKGLQFYYRDVYDGLSAGNAEQIFSGQSHWYRERANLVAAHASPRTWLDVGAGHGHFCATAADVLPDTAFDGLDIGAGIEEAHRRNWVRHGLRGEFRALTSELAGRYDVVSMNHYLEHTTDPLAELDAAATTLRPGGHLLIELPDPDAWAGRFLRSFWIALLPPQHLHMIPLANLTAALTERGFAIISAERDGVRVEGDFTAAALVLANVLGPDPHRPWAPTRRTGTLRQILAYTAVVPLILTAILTDAAIRILRPKNSNSYRVLAQSPPP
ncbi:hypothetical protein GCM10010411_13190 [Actinomadura fulvescens]|uniref:Methyltransferase n=1 Tax=Actinomadura fulvescens TaxID=46160 RepID=A0ABN3PHE7_9ACTN